MGKSKSSRQWLDRHFKDEYVKRAQAEGYRSRASFKLLELQEKNPIIKPNYCIVDLGSAPGGWSQIARKLVGKKGRVVGLDILPMDPIDGVEFIQGDFREASVLDELNSVLNGQPVDLVMSDMAPNITGIAAVDQPSAMYLCELALELAREVLHPGGRMVVKTFQGEGFDDFFREVKGSFSTVRNRKPKASRSRSREVYLVAEKFNI